TGAKCNSGALQGTASIAAPIFTADTPLTTATVGTAYTYTFTATGNPPPTFALGSGSLPTNVTLTSAGVLSGTPTVSGPFTFTVTASNSQGSVTSASITITVGAALVAPSFTADSPPTTASVGTAYSYTFAATGNPAPTFALGSGTLPPHQRRGALGHAHGHGPFTFTAVASNTQGSVTSASIIITVSAASKVTLSIVAPTTLGGPLGVTATVTNASSNPALPTPTGTVRFTITGVTCAGGSNTLTLVGGAATCSFTTTSGFGARVSYSGDTNYSASSATAVMGTSTLSAPVALWVASHGVWTLDAQLLTDGGGLKGDTVTFKAGSTTLCTATTDASGIATCQVSPSATATTGTTFVATFSGNTLVMPTTSASGTLPAP
ncbi:MAG: putative Ig domain-containing protein, partial [Acidimicrobiales bacterium]